LYWENCTTHIPKIYDEIIIKKVVKIDPAVIKDLLPVCLVPYLNKIEVVSRIMIITKIYLLITMIGTLSINTSRIDVL
jgi:hypothetical protein